MGIFFLTYVSTENKVPAIFLMRVILALGGKLFFPNSCNLFNNVCWFENFINFGLDECKTNEHNCSENGFCVDTVGSFTCHCFEGYDGNGLICTPAPLRPGVQSESEFRFEILKNW